MVSHGLNTFLVLFLFSCADNIEPNIEKLNFGSDETLDIITWNLKEFPWNYEMTVPMVIDVINNVDVDIVALQEIDNNVYFDLLILGLPEWSGYRSPESSINLAFLYKDSIQLESVGEIHALNDNYSFPRTPIMITFQWGEINKTIYLINNHWKAYGGSENEDRRRSASEKTEEYINDFLNNENVIILGDFNDELQDEESSNVFQNFIDDPVNYLITDMGIAYGSELNWSYPTWPSHIDHIIITKELFDEFENSLSTVSTMRVDESLYGGWYEYENNISDHRPVGIRLYIGE